MLGTILVWKFGLSVDEEFVFVAEFNLTEADEVVVIDVRRDRWLAAFPVVFEIGV